MSLSKDVGLWQQAFDWAEHLIGVPIPAYVKIPLGILTVVAVAALVITTIVVCFGKLVKTWQETLRPLVYKPEQKQKASARQRFAQHLTLEITARNRTENWRDQDFTELEAEVEAEGERRRFLPFPWRRRGLRRERSLSIALRKSDERLVLVEGEPGSGKSVALRHVAFDLAKAGETSRRIDSPLPVYINLKELRRDSTAPIDIQLIYNLAKMSLNRVNDIFVDEYVDAEFDVGIKEGRWIFLFDSFDEIPEILSSTDTDEIISSYSLAISNFMSGMNACRGVVSSRSYRGPSRMGWTTFRILPLSSSRQIQLIKRSLINKPELVTTILNSLAISSGDIREVARNPMLLGLLCEHIKLGRPFPASSYEILSTYVDYRLTRDSERLRLRYNISPSELRSVAEQIAFAMTADSSLGLEASVDDLQRSLARQNFTLSADRLQRGVDGLIYMRLGRAVEQRGAALSFTFAHRRFQEFFATRVVHQAPDRVRPADLLSDARWRETAVVLLQTEHAGAVTPILQTAQELLEGWTDNRPLPVQQGRNSDVDPSQETNVAGSAWVWPRSSLHVLGILEAGARLNPSIISDEIRGLVARILSAAFEDGDLLDKRLVLEVASLLPNDLFVSTITSALNLESQIIDDEVYRQAARLPIETPPISAALRKSIITMMASGELTRSIGATRAYVARLGSSSNLIAVTNLSYWAVFVDNMLLLALAAAAIPGRPINSIAMILIGVIGIAVGRHVYLKTNFSRLGNSFGNQLGIMGSFLVFLAVTRSDESWLRMDLDPWDRLAEMGHDIRVAMLSGGWVWLLVIPAVAFWFPAAIVCARKGRFVKPLLWPVIPIAGAAFQIHSAIADSKFRLVGFLMGGLILLGAVGGFFYLMTLPLFSILFAIITFLVSSIVVLGLMRYWQRRYLDFRVVRRAKSIEIISAEDFSRIYGVLRTRRGAVAFIGVVGRRPLQGELIQWVSAINAILNADDFSGPMIKRNYKRRFFLARFARYLAELAIRVGDRETIREHRDAVFLLLEQCSERKK